MKKEMSREESIQHCVEFMDLLVENLKSPNPHDLSEATYIIVKKAKEFNLTIPVELLTDFERYIKEYIEEEIEAEQLDEDEDFNSWVDMFVTGRYESYDILRVCENLNISKRAFTNALRQHQIDRRLVKVADVAKIEQWFENNEYETLTVGRSSRCGTITTAKDYLKRYAAFTLQGVVYLPIDEELEC